MLTINPLLEMLYQVQLRPALQTLASLRLGDPVLRDLLSHLLHRCSYEPAARRLPIGSAGKM